MRKILLSTSNEDEQRIAVTENGLLIDYLSVFTGQEDRKGSIFCGFIEQIEQSLEACFVNIGGGKKGFLQFSEIDQSCLLDKPGELRERLDVGQPILVQITKDSRSEKGPLLTTRIKLTGNHLILMPRERNQGIMRISQRADDKERERLEAARDELALPDSMSMIIRSHGVARPLTDLVWELQKNLLPLWQLIQQVFSKQEKPELIYEYQNIVNSCIIEYLTPTTVEIVCDNANTAQELQSTMESINPDATTTAVRTIGPTEALFDESLLEQFDALLARKVKLPAGGELVIDITEALVSVDVNSRRSNNQKDLEATALKTNLEAATELATQLKLRNLSGLIVIDFIDMDSEDSRQSLEKKLRQVFSRDRAQISISKISQFGLVEMTRQNIGRSLHESHSVLCDHCNGLGRLPTVRSFAQSILDRIRETCLKPKQVGSIIVELPMNPATFLLNEKRDELKAIFTDFGVEVIVLPSHSMQAGEHNFRIDKNVRGHNTKPSYKQNSSKALEHDSYINDKKNYRKKMTPAITSQSHRQQPPPTVNPAMNVSSITDDYPTASFWSKILKSFTGPTKVEADNTKPTEARPRQANRRSNGGRGPKARGTDNRNKNRAGQRKDSEPNSRNQQRQGQRKGKPRTRKPSPPDLEETINASFKKAPPNSEISTEQSPAANARGSTTVPDKQSNSWTNVLAATANNPVTSPPNRTADTPDTAKYPQAKPLDQEPLEQPKPQRRSRGNTVRRSR